MRGFWGVAVAAVAAVVAVALVGCAPGTTSSATPDTTPTSNPQSASTSSAASPATVVSIVDGDTIETSAGTVRIIGIDAPERDVCGYAEATALLSSLIAPGDSVVLQLPDGQNESDKYGRLLRYVDTVQGVDVAASLLTAGLAIARYDSTDGYPAHPREAGYRAAQIATISAGGGVTTVACKATADAEAEAAEQARLAAEQQAAQQAAQPPAAAPVVDEWWRQYTSCTKLKKNTVGHPTGPFSRDNPAEAAIYDWFANGTGNNGDGEGDGLACE